VVAAPGRYARPVEPVRTEGLDHVAITVADLERSHDFYANVLGLERVYEEWHEPVFMVAAGSGLALFSRESHPGSGDGPPEIRVMHIAFRVSREQFDRARAELPEVGIDPRFVDHGASHSIYFPDPDGHEIELTTYDV
jgi:catechol 2,3-dioxygenase-like lactoylglutathione lyase family enzyme